MRTRRRFDARPVVVLAVGLGALVGAGIVLRALTTGLGGWDLRTVTSVAAWRGSTAVTTAHVASVFGRSWLLVPLAAVVGWALRRGGRGWVPLGAVVVAIVAQNVIKAIVQRPRPPVVHLEHVTSWSFPSGHATDSTAFLAAVLVAAWPWLGTAAARIGAILAAALAELVIAGARVTLGVHYPTDVLAGVVLGVLAAALAAYALEPSVRFGAPLRRHSGAARRRRPLRRCRRSSRRRTAGSRSRTG